MIKRLAKIAGLAILAPFLAFASVLAAYSGSAHTGIFGGLREIHEAKDPIHYLAYTVGYALVSCGLFFMLWKEVRAFREWRRHRNQPHKFSGVIDP